MFLFNRKNNNLDAGGDSGRKRMQKEKDNSVQQHGTLSLRRCMETEAGAHGAGAQTRRAGALEGAGGPALLCSCFLSEKDVAESKEALGIWGPRTKCAIVVQERGGGKERMAETGAAGQRQGRLGTQGH